MSACSSKESRCTAAPTMSTKPRAMVPNAERAIYRLENRGVSLLVVANGLRQLRK